MEVICTNIDNNLLLGSGPRAPTYRPAAELSGAQFENTSWDGGNDRLREKLLSFIGKIGQDSRLGQTAVKMLDALWELARVPALPPKLVHQAMNEHLTILNESATRDQVKERQFKKMHIMKWFRKKDKYP
ncbi:Ubiquitin carboxyl-terminal hydrolase 24 [Portunus trituberculatus]|uniref:Ubiquitin carboxyl-terminal hydrolase 24 n=1 Tax=Portunus trituberculatus TaxID=210409 RepID=A0A5B7FL76_PORTR|nr:Ubiquitin carboxyl-terminal hydrolase 24 [Portunus trituberculatus]